MVSLSYPSRQNQYRHAPTRVARWTTTIIQRLVNVHVLELQSQAQEEKGTPKKKSQSELGRPIRLHSTFPKKEGSAGKTFVTRRLVCVYSTSGAGCVRIARWALAVVQWNLLPRVVFVRRGMQWLRPVLTKVGHLWSRATQTLDEWLDQLLE